ncbi:MAG: hypothetical protein ACK5ME_13270 [Parahaliea sp.]
MPDSLVPAAVLWQEAFLQRHQLSSDYLLAAHDVFAPLAMRLCQQRQQVKDMPLVVGINGCQGSGKSTLVDYLACVLRERHQLNSVCLSLDDFYLGYEARQQLAQTVHPLLATRGVPGTHDIPLMNDVLNCLRQGRALGLPRFDKASDDRLPLSHWPQVSGAVDVVLFEGWCLGLKAQTATQLDRPVNTLEAEEDGDGCWRHWVNDVLRRDFPAVHALVDYWLMLCSPAFSCVQRWRQEQEDKLRQRLGPMALARTMDAAALSRFLQHYQRLTEWSLVSLPDEVDECFMLDENRRVCCLRLR